MTSDFMKSTALFTARDWSALCAFVSVWLNLVHCKNIFYIKIENWWIQMFIEPLLFPRKNHIKQKSHSEAVVNKRTLREHIFGRRALLRRFLRFLTCLIPLVGISDFVFFPTFVFLLPLWFVNWQFAPTSRSCLAIAEA